MIRDQLVGNTEENICSGNTFGSSRKGRGGGGGREEFLRRARRRGVRGSSAARASPERATRERERESKVVKKSQRETSPASPATDRDLIPIRAMVFFSFFS